MPEPIDPSPDRAARKLHQGAARGGPLHDREVVSRYPKGFVAVDLDAGTAWIYDYTDGAFRVREPEGRPLDDERRWHAAEGADYDVVAVA